MHAFMQEALREAHLALPTADVPVGAVVVVDGRSLGAAAISVRPWRDPTAHAEILALREAAQSLRELATHHRDLVRHPRTLYHVYRRGNIEPHPVSGVWLSGSESWCVWFPI